MAAPVIESWAAQAVGSGIGSIVVPKPSGVAVDDLLLIFAYANGTVQTWSSAGFTPVGDTAGTAGSALLMRVADGSEGSTITVTRGVSNTAAAAAIIVRISGTDLADAIDAFGFATGSGGTTTLPTQSPEDDENLLVHILGKTSSTGTFTPPGTTDEVVDGTTGGTALGYGIGEEVVGAGPTGTRAWGYTGAGGSRAVMVSINPVTEAEPPESQGSGFFALL